MAYRRCSIECRAKMTLRVENEKDIGIEHTDFMMSHVQNIDMRAYKDEKDNYTTDGIRMMSNTFIQALVGCIHLGHQTNQIDSAEHLRYIISELERGFIDSAAIVNKAKF